MKKDIIKNTINKITDEQIIPKPRWHFIFMEMLYWIFFNLSVALGAIAVSFILCNINNEFHPAMMKLDNLYSMMMYIPFIWILLLIVFCIFSIYYWKKTDKGYKFNLSIVLIAILIFSLIFGYVLYSAKITSRLDKHLYQVPGYHQLSKKKAQHLMKVYGQNWIGGQVSEELQNTEFILKDFQDQLVNIEIKKVPVEQRRIIRVNEK
jgi:hypothetical protein